MLLFSSVHDWKTMLGLIHRASCLLLWLLSLSASLHCSCLALIASEWPAPLLSRTSVCINDRPPPPLPFHLRVKGFSVPVSLTVCSPPVGFVFLKVAWDVYLWDLTSKGRFESLSAFSSVVDYCYIRKWKINLSYYRKKKQVAAIRVSCGRSYYIFADSNQTPIWEMVNLRTNLLVHCFHSRAQRVFHFIFACFSLSGFFSFLCSQGNVRCAAVSKLELSLGETFKVKVTWTNLHSRGGRTSRASSLHQTVAYFPKWIGF